MCVSWEQLEGNRAAIFDIRIQKRVSLPCQIDRRDGSILFRPAKRALKFGEQTWRFKSRPGAKDHTLTAPSHRNMQKEPTEPLKIKEEISTEPTAKPVLNRDTPSLKKRSSTG